jgi:hypothetical protein
VYDDTIRSGPIRRIIDRPHDLAAVTLVQPQRLRWQLCRHGQSLAVLSHRSRVIPDVVAEIEGLEGAPADAPCAGRYQCMDGARHRPIGVYQADVHPSRIASASRRRFANSDS